MAELALIVAFGVLALYCIALHQMLEFTRGQLAESRALIEDLEERVDVWRAVTETGLEPTRATY